LIATIVRQTATVVSRNEDDNKNAARQDTRIAHFRSIFAMRRIIFAWTFNWCRAIRRAEITEGDCRTDERVGRGEKHQVLLGVTGSGKTFTMAKIIEQSNRPALILAHNKTLAAQLYHEFKQFFPNNAVEYFVSYYDYYSRRLTFPPGLVYREGSDGQRGAGQAAALGYAQPLRAGATRSLSVR